VEDQVDREDLPQLARADALADLPHPLGEAVGEVDGKEAVGGARGIDHGARLRGGAAERLLAEHRGAALQRAHRLLRVQRAGRGDHDPVQPQGQQLVQPGDDLRARGRFLRRGDHLRGGIGDGGHLGHAGVGDGLHAVAPDPPHAQEAQARRGKLGGAGVRELVGGCNQDVGHGRSGSVRDSAM